MLRERVSAPPGELGYRSFPNSSTGGLRTTPWMACDPKCVAAGPPNTSVIFEFVTEYRPSSPPVTQTCSVDTGGSDSNGAMLPFPVNRLTVSVNWKPILVAGG